MADRVNRWQLMFLTQSLRSLIMLLIALTIAFGITNVWLISGMTAANSAVMAFNAPARQALVPALVPRSGLMSAIGLNSAAFNGGSVIGPSVGGIGIGLIGVSGCFFLSFFCTVIVLLCLLKINPQAGIANFKGGKMWQNLMAGFSYIRHTKTVLGIIVLMALPSLLARPYIQLMPAFKEALMLDATAYGFLLAATGLGAVAGSLTVAAMGSTRRRGVILLVATAVLA